MSNGSNLQYIVTNQFRGPGDNSDATLPYIIPPPLSQSPNKKDDIVFTVQDVFVSGTGDNCVINAGDGTTGPNGEENVDFSLKRIQTNSTNAQVSVSPTNVWSNKAAKRNTLMQSFVRFLQQVEALENGVCLSGGASDVVQQVVAENIPVSIDESMFYQYGFDTENAYISLQAGMRLRLDTASFQYAGSERSEPGQLLNGFVGVGSSNYVISRRPSDRRLSFDGFLGVIRPPEIIDASGGQGNVIEAGGIIDLMSKGAARFHLNLFYPPQFVNGETGSASISNNVTIIGTDTLTDMATAISTYTGSGTCASSGDLASGLRDIECTFFRGRDIAIPEVMVTLQGQQQFYPIGNTVRNLMDIYWNWIPFKLTSGAGVYRLYDRQYYPVQFVQNIPTPHLSNLDAFDLPILKGDVIDIATPSIPS